MTQRITKCPDPQKWQAAIAANYEPDESGCWIWKAGIDRNGYGRFRCRVDGQRRMTGAHRAAWLAYRGDIPEAHVIDHLCRVKACCNPDHLEPVTHSENLLRGDHSAKKGAYGGVYACLTHGQEDGYVVPQVRGHGRWTCRICRRARNAALRARNAAA